MNNISASDATVSDAVTTKKRTIFRPQGMGMRMTYKCVIGCRHCYQKAVAQSDAEISKEALINAIRTGYDAGMRNIGFSGGEPMLCSDAVLDGMAQAINMGYDGNIGLQTNGFWGKTPESARKIIKKMAEAGFAPPKGRINLSVGEFHQEWLPMTTISNVVKAYWEEFGHPVSLNVTFSKGNKAVFHKLEDHFKKCGIPREAYNPLIYPSVAHVGRANEVIADDADPADPVAKFKECTAINKFTVEPNGKVAPCCGFNRYINGISVGNINTESISEIIANTNTNIIYHYIKFKPLHEIHRLLSEKFDLKTHYRHKCELCQELMGSEEHVAYLESIAERELAGQLNPGSRPQSRRFFHDDVPAVEPEQAIAPPPEAAGEPAPAARADDSALDDLEQRLTVLEEENAKLRSAIFDSAFSQLAR